METLEIAKQVRSKIMTAMEAKGANDNTLKEALHNAFTECLTAAKGGAGPVDQSAEQMAKAGLESFFMLAKDPVLGSVAVMREVVDSSGRLGLDTTSLMQAALFGIARAVPKSRQTSLPAIKMALDEAYHGVGEFFDEAVKKAQTAAL